MSYGNVILGLQTKLKADTTLDAYNHECKIHIGEDQPSLSNAHFFSEIRVPDGVFIIPKNEHVSDDVETAADYGVADIERYEFQFLLYKGRLGKSDREELTGDGRNLLTFLDDVRNAIGDYIFDTANEFCDFEMGPVSSVQNEGQGGFVLEFRLIIEEQVEVRNR